VNIEVPSHLAGCSRCSALYKLLAAAYALDRGVEYDAECDQEHLCDHCGVTSCATQGCKCADVLCPHGRQHLRQPDVRYTRGMDDFVQDRCENAPFACIGGLGARSDPIRPKFMQPRHWPAYLLGYTDAAATAYGPDWATIEFGWKPALTIGAERDLSSPEDDNDMDPSDGED
jgi:hypothetical protein